MEQQMPNKFNSVFHFYHPADLQLYSRKNPKSDYFLQIEIEILDIDKSHHKTFSTFSTSSFPVQFVHKWF